MTHRFRPQVGKYAIPIPEFYIQRLDFGKEERKLKEIIGMETGYSIPFTKDNLDKIKNMGMALDGKITYLVETATHLKISIASYDDLRNGVFEELLHFGKIPTQAQRQAWLEKEGGPQADIKRHDDFKRMVEEREVPPKIPTEREVRSMIEEAVKAQKVSKEEAQVLKKTEIEGKPEEQAVKEVSKQVGRPPLSKKK